MLHQIAKAIQAANDARTTNGAAPYEVKCYAYDYYGEIPDAGCANIAPDPTMSYLTNPSAISVADLTFFKVSKPAPDAAVVCTPESQDLLSEAGKSLAKIQATAESNAMTLADLAKMYAEPGAVAPFGAAEALGALSETITEYRKRTDFATSDSAPQKYHIRATPNNDESSRSHFFIDMYIQDGAKLVGRATVLDMAGSEKVSTIQEDYFTLIKLSVADIIKRIKNAINNPAIEQKLVEFLDKEFLIQSFSSVRPTVWVNLRKSFVNLLNADNTFKNKIYDDILTLVLLNDAYNYLNIMCQYVKLYNKFISIANIQLKSARSEVVPEFDALIIPDFDDLNTIKSYLGKEGASFSSYKKSAVIIKNEYNKYLTKLINAIENTKQVVGQEESNKYELEFAEIALLTSNSLEIIKKEGDINKNLARMDSIKAKYHCPIRYQGNFINASLHWLKLYVSNLANGTAPTSDQAADVFTNTLMRQSLNGAAGATAPAFDRKFVLMTNIRLDFDKADDTDARRKNYRDAATVSLQFAHCINPFASKSAGHYDCDKPLPAAAPPQPVAPRPPAARPASAASASRAPSQASLAQGAAALRAAQKSANIKQSVAADSRRSAAVSTGRAEAAETRAKDLTPRGARTDGPKRTTKGFRGGSGAYDPTAETSLAHVQALGLVVLFALSIGLAERTTSPTRQRLRIGSAPPPALVRAGFTVAFLIFYTLTTLIWATLGVVRFGAYLLHLLFFYTLVATFAGVLFKNKSQAGSILLSFVLSLTAFFADA